MRVGFIGLGNMGLPMAANLIEAGFTLSVFNRTRSKAEELAARGASIADSPADLTRRADIVLSCLADVAASREVFLGPNGVVSAARAGQILCDHATVDLATSRAVDGAARAKGALFLDAPISGGPEGAKAGTLSIMAGGEREAFERARPVFQAMGKTIVHMGPTGSGTVTKLANQLLVGVHALAACEALTLAWKAGADLGKVMEVLKNSWGQSRVLERSAPRLIAREFGPSAAPARNLLKDLSIIRRLGEELGLDLSAAGAAERALAALIDEGRGAWDFSALALRVERRRA